MAPVAVMLLGPPRVEREGQPVAFDTRKALALLALLALTDGPRSRDALAELLWPGHDPEHARGALRRTLSTLRGAVGGDAVDAGRDRVRLVREAGVEIDVDAFRALVAAGDAEAAVARYRGGFLEGFGLRDAPGFDDWQRAEGDALERELAAALAAVTDAREAAGDLAGAIRHARRGLELDPLHEPAHQRLIRLYAASGDRAAALSQYRECVRTLSRELGVAPLQETTRLYEAVSEGTIEPVAAGGGPAPPGATPGGPAAPVVAPGGAAGPGAAPGGLTPLVGRDADRAALVAAYEAVTGAARVAAIEGEAGIGKTRLAEEVLAHVAAHGGVALTGRGYEDESALAYGPLVEALRGRLRGDRGWLDAVGDRALAEAARLVGELADARPGLPAPPPLDGPGAEARFMDALWDVLAAATAGEAPGVLLVDDAQWADEATLGLLAYGLRRPAGRRMLVLVTWRTPHEDRLRRVVADLRRAGQATVRVLERLSEAEVGELVRRSAADAAPAELYEQTEGLPFLLVEYLGALRAGGGGRAAGFALWANTRKGTRPPGPAFPALPTGARELLRARLEPVSETGRQVLAAAAVLGRSFGVDTVRGVSGRGDEETVAALEELVARGLVRERASDYDFAHEQLRALAYEDAGLARRRLLHGRAAEALRLEAAGRTGPGGAPPERAAAVARHLALAGRDAEAAAAHAQAADHARSLFANAQALEHLDAALALGHPEAGPLHAARGDVLTLLGEYGAARAAYETAAALAAPGDLAGLEHRLGRLHHRGGDLALAEAHLRAALAATEDDEPALRSEVQADLSLVADDGGEPERAAELAAAALELAQRAGDPRALGRAHNLLGVLATGRGEPAEARAQLERAYALAEQTADPGARVAALNNLALAWRTAGDVDRALVYAREALAQCAAQGDRHREAALRNNVADLLHEAGQAAEAMDELKRAVTLFAEVGSDEPAPGVWKLVRW